MECGEVVVGVKVAEQGTGNKGAELDNRVKVQKIRHSEGEHNVGVLVGK